MFTIYLITNLVNGKVYVGQTNQLLERRWTLHKSRSRRNEGYTAHLYNAMRKYGIDAFSIVSITTCETSDQANTLEAIWIILLDSTNPKVGYNMTSGGDRREMTPEVIEKITSKTRGQKRSPEVCQKQSENLRRGWATGSYTGNRGQKLSQKTRDKMSNSRRGSKHPRFNHSVDSKELVALWNSGTKTKEIATHFGICDSTVRRRIASSGVPFRPFWEVRTEQATKVERLKLDETLLRELLKTDISLREIGRRMGTDHHTISHRMKKLGLTRE